MARLKKSLSLPRIRRPVRTDPVSGDIQAIGQASERRRSACNRSIVPVVVGNLDDAMLVSGVGLPMAVSMFK